MSRLRSSFEAGAKCVPEVKGLCACMIESSCQGMAKSAPSMKALEQFDLIKVGRSPDMLQHCLTGLKQ